jgi:hypothetical protein
MTISKDLWKDQGQLLLDQLLLDARSNSDGYGLVLAGGHELDALVTKSKDIEPIERMLCFLEWERAWIHCRAATTKNETVGDCHPFVAYDSGKAYYIMHNGILSGYGADTWRVDSKLIADIINSYGVHAALAHLQEHQYFANVFIVCPESGEWFVSRSTGGLLHTDGLGNYSTRSVGSISQAVKPHEMDHYQMVIKKTSKNTTYYSYPAKTGSAAAVAARDFTPTERFYPPVDDYSKYTEATLAEREHMPSGLWDGETGGEKDPHADMLPAELKQKASLYLDSNRDEIEAEWDKYEASTRYHRM